MDEKIAREIIARIKELIYDEDSLNGDFKRNITDEVDTLEQCIDGALEQPKFEVGEFVYDCKYEKDEKNKSVVQINSRSYSEDRGWIYFINYVGIDKKTSEVTVGGSSGWWDEKCFKKIDDPLLLMIIHKWKLEKELHQMNVNAKSLESKLEKIYYALRVASGVSP